jgi:hypothetical protein
MTAGAGRASDDSSVSDDGSSLVGFVVPDDEPLETMGSSSGASSRGTSVESSPPRDLSLCAAGVRGVHEQGLKRKRWCVLPEESSDDDDSEEVAARKRGRVCRADMDAAGGACSAQEATLMEAYDDLTRGLRSSEVGDSAGFWFKRAQMLQEMSLAAMRTGLSRMKCGREAH